ncbi:MAG TPA: hypothetical protein ENN84_12135 [Candidatus Marinimicrobia bacterium]|nr:hypothetical protein [Candidatus Neomarinimicrobiota bacterium]
MKRATLKFNFTILLLGYFIVSLLKSDKDVFAFHEYLCHPQQRYTEQVFVRDTLKWTPAQPDYSKISQAIIINKKI